MRTMSNMNKSLSTMIGLVLVAILIVFATVGCGGSSPTEPAPYPTPTPTPTPNPTPGPTPTPTPTPQPGIITVTPLSASPVSGSTLVIGQRVTVNVSVSGVTSGTLAALPSTDGVSPSSSGDGVTVPISGAGIVALAFRMNAPGKTVAVLFSYTPSGGHPTIVPGVIYRVEYTWINPTLVVSIGSGGVFTPRDLGTVARGTVITYRNDDTIPHQPVSINTGMVDCPGIFNGEVCTVTTFNNTGAALRIGVRDTQNSDPNAEVHSFTVNP